LEPRPGHRLNDCSQKKKKKKKKKSDAEIPIETFGFLSRYYNYYYYSYSQSCQNLTTPPHRAQTRREKKAKIKSFPRGIIISFIIIIFPESAHASLLHVILHRSILRPHEYRFYQLQHERERENKMVCVCV